MDENKQIDGMARLMCKYYADDPNCYRCPDCWVRDEAKVLYEAGYRKQEWISVEERLPEQYTAVIVCDENRFIGEAEYDGYSFRWGPDENLAFATHWMPLPDAPKGE